ncbi:MAG: hypothetical protein JNM43_09880 [Planctomycetaceae bacterium]|nr:hypothetical protein [Planctomycetaceae bacterium]
MEKERLRKRIQGLEGPYECVTVATDALDNVRVWIRELSREQQAKALHLFVELIEDSDAVVATGAVLALDFLDRPFDGLTLSQMLLRRSESLQRSPIGFQRISYGRIFEECFSRLCLHCHRLEPQVIEDLWKLEYPADKQSSAMFLLAQTYPDLIVYHAASSLRHSDVHVLCALRQQWDRIAVAGALRVWPDAAITEAERLMRLRNVDSKDSDAVLRVMKDDYHQLTHPRGFADYRKWWIVGGRPWQWTMWEASDGAMVLEVVQDGPGEVTSSRLLSEREIQQFRTRHCTYSLQVHN